MIIGITGTNGAGKGTVVEYLAQKKGFAHFSVRAMLVEEIERRGLLSDRSSMRLVGNELREKNGPSYLVETAFRKIQDSGIENAVIESIRNSGEAGFLKEHGAKLLVVDADRKLRYERIQARASETDRIDFDTFVQQEEREWHGTEGKADMDVMNVIAMADATVMNNGSIEALDAEVENVLSRLSVSAQ